MSSVYSELFYHFVWATKEREDLIAPEMEEHLFAYIRHKSHEINAQVHALNGMPNHVHLACSLPVTLCVADFAERIKGSSSHFINHLPEKGWSLRWQTGYGVTFAKGDLARVVAYIHNQKHHHACNSLSPKMERMPDALQSNNHSPL
jgi:putative transposase